MPQFARRAAPVLLAAILAAAPCARGQVAPTPMIAIPAGPFTMGSNTGREDERPAHTVVLGAFEIDRTHVTNAQFAAFLEARGATAPDGARYFDFDDADARIHRRNGRWSADEGTERNPVVEATWLGAREYCAWTGRRLPTEAEWEKAARGTDGRRHPWGAEAPTAARAHYGGGWHDLAPVGQRPQGASPYGVLDMAGNGWQWVSSAYRPYPYRADDGREDPAPGPVRGTRGGGHDARPADLTTTQRGRHVSRNPAAGHHNIGFRCAL